MRTDIFRAPAGLAALLVLAALAGPAAAATDSLPRFTEEREAAALHFVKKNLPELLPFLEELRKGDALQYQKQVREIFQVTELLADLDDERRYELELKIWQSENRAYIMVARLSTPSADERKRLEAELQDLAKDLVDLDVQVLELKADQLDKELGEVKDELAKAKENSERQARERYEGLLDKAKRRKK